MKIAIAQINTTVGDFEGNAAKIIKCIGFAERSGAELVIFPEMSVTSYPPNDLLEKKYFISKSLETAEKIAKKCVKVAAIVGLPTVNESLTGKGLFNSAAFLANGRIEFLQHKTLLPTYDVFYESRYFNAGTGPLIYSYHGQKLGITICEDIWSAVLYEGRKLYDCDPVETLVKSGAEIIINISASPFHVGKGAIRKDLLTQAAKNHKVPIVYVNSVGGNDDLVFDGHSLIVNEKGEIVCEAKKFQEDSLIVDLDAGKTCRLKPAVQNDVEDLHNALLLGLSDYVRKCKFKKVVIGLSGGIDSALVAALAVEALGAKNVLGVAMPSPYSSKSSVTDAKALAKNLGIKLKVIPITEIYRSYLQTLNTTVVAKFTLPKLGRASSATTVVAKLALPNFGRASSATTEVVTLSEENIQARIRGNVLMAISNKTNALVLSTGNKSELAVGYCTLYGDMAGGLAVISDVPKTSVYELAKFINRKKTVIPRSTITKPPSAELRPDQKDSDSLPPYEILDEILKLYIEDHASPRSIIKKGFNAKVVEDVVLRVDRNEYKRRQAAPGLKVTSKAFGAGRRYPIVWKF